MMDITCISDLHGFYPELEGGDLLIVAGDWTRTGLFPEVLEFQKWLCQQKYECKVIICGNHDTQIYYYENGCNPWKFDKHVDAHYLQDSGIQFKGLKIWGSPWSLWFDRINPECAAFTGSEEDLEKHYAKIPDDTDILITHGPAYGFGDKVIRQGLDDQANVHKWKESVGSKSLLKWTAGHNKTLKLHVFGHIHEGYGIWDSRNDPYPIPVLVNASHVNEKYKPVNKPIRVVL